MNLEDVVRLIVFGFALCLLPAAVFTFLGALAAEEKSVDAPPKGEKKPQKVSEAEVRAQYSELSRLAQEAERLARHETALIVAQSERDVAQAHADFVKSLSERDRGLFAAWLKVQAEARDKDSRQ